MGREIMPNRLKDLRNAKTVRKKMEEWQCDLKWPVGVLKEGKVVMKVGGSMQRFLTSFCLVLLQGMGRGLGAHSSLGISFFPLLL